jgi:hypothetical protein
MPHEPKIGQLNPKAPQALTIEITHVPASATSELVEGLMYVAMEISGGRTSGFVMARERKIGQYWHKEVKHG